MPRSTRQDREHRRRRSDAALREGDFGGILKTINLAYVPEAKVGDYVLVHVGFAISIVDEAEAQQVFEYLRADGRTRGAGGNEAR